MILIVTNSVIIKSPAKQHLENYPIRIEIDIDVNITMKTDPKYITYAFEAF